MTRDQAIKLILMRCGMRQNDKALQEACVVEMQLAQQTKCERAGFKPWFLLSENSTTITMPGENRVPVPKDFLQEYEEGALRIRAWDEDREEEPGYTVPPWQPLRKFDEDDSEDVYGTVANRPLRYSIVNGYFVITPAPDYTYMLRMRYYKAAPLITEPYGEEGSVTSNVWLQQAPDWLIGETGLVIAGSYIKDDATAAKFADQAKTARDAIYVEHCAREEANRTRSMGDD
jgi:hypothetical protein